MMRCVRTCAVIAFGSAIFGTLAGEANAFSDASTDHAAACDAAAVMAGVQFGIPDGVMLAIARTEAGRTFGGAFIPWPWTVNQAGDGSFFENADAAIDHVANAMRNGESNIDIGCFQINLHWHGDAFGSLSEMFDPERNAAYAAEFLTRLYQEFGSWDGAIGAYHSRRPEDAAAYLARVGQQVSTLSADSGSRAAVTPSSRKNGFPLLRGDGARGPGSLVALRDNDDARPLLR